jgi:hypothetical protein
VVRELAWQRRAHGLALEQEQPGYLRAELGPVPESTRGRRAWRQAAAAIEDYRQSYDVREPDRALGPVPRDPIQRAAWQHAHDLVERVWGKQRAERDWQRTTRDYTGWDHPDARRQSPRQRPVGRHGPERAAG